MQNIVEMDDPVLQDKIYDHLKPGAKVKYVFRQTNSVRAIIRCDEEYFYNVVGEGHEQVVGFAGLMEIVDTLVKHSRMVGANDDRTFVSFDRVRDKQGRLPFFIKLT